MLICPLINLNIVSVRGGSVEVTGHNELTEIGFNWIDVIYNGTFD